MDKFDDLGADLVSAINSLKDALDEAEDKELGDLIDDINDKLEAAVNKVNELFELVEDEGNAIH